MSEAAARLPRKRHTSRRVTLLHTILSRQKRTTRKDRGHCHQTLIPLTFHTTPNNHNEMKSSNASMSISRLMNNRGQNEHVFRMPVLQERVVLSDQVMANSTLSNTTVKFSFSFYLEASAAHLLCTLLSILVCNRPSCCAGALSVPFLRTLVPPALASL